MREIALFIVSGLMLVCFIGTLIQAFRMSEMAHRHLDDYETFTAWSVAYLVLADVAMLGTIVSFAAARGYIE